ncbi:hypothetical protein [Paenibacillus roseipurpureus]|uniref:Uncharacterized protein n=1 Tax=Paenibacillus roseopurpureus TaxID=2918901 RepID=A0AA96LM66_9BACL|nr:hypothetical protein [Paenibacillus sp. MBLB1832]WNR43681.1 hypothetical protein MJB10_21650 [Paenibacillus sp. MBLB1832]
MLKQKLIRVYMENVIWFIPVVILIAGTNPSVKESVWWKVLGFVLFMGIVLLCIRSWREAHREQRIEERRYNHEPIVLKQFN